MEGSPRESPASMVIPLVILALGAALAGFLGVPEGLSGGISRIISSIP